MGCSLTWVSLAWVFSQLTLHFASTIATSSAVTRYLSFLTNLKESLIVGDVPCVETWVDAASNARRIGGGGTLKGDLRPPNIKAD